MRSPMKPKPPYDEHPGEMMDFVDLGGKESSPRKDMLLLKVMSWIVALWGALQILQAFLGMLRIAGFK